MNDPRSPARAKRPDRPADERTLPWWPAERPAVGDREPLTRDRIVQAALALVDRDGLDALSMRNLGEELGAGTTSVYWHVANKDQLLDLLMDEIMGEAAAAIRPMDDWRSLLHEHAWVLRRVLTRHRHAVSIFGARAPIGPKALGGFERLLERLLEAGFDQRDALLVGNTVINFAAGWAVFECRAAAGPVADAGQTPEELDQAVMELMRTELPHEVFPALASVSAAVGVITWDEQFEYALERLLDGIGLVSRGAGPTG